MSQWMLSNRGQLNDEETRQAIVVVNSLFLEVSSYVISCMNLISCLAILRVPRFWISKWLKSGKHMTRFIHSSEVWTNEWIMYFRSIQQQSVAGTRQSHPSPINRCRRCCSYMTPSEADCSSIAQPLKLALMKFLSAVIDGDRIPKRSWSGR